MKYPYTTQIDPKYVEFVHGFIYDDYIPDPDIVDWLGENCDGEWTFDWSNGEKFSFEKESDAIVFKLTWGGA